MEVMQRWDPKLNSYVVLEHQPSNSFFLRPNWCILSTSYSWVSLCVIKSWSVCIFSSTGLNGPNPFLMIFFNHLDPNLLILLSKSLWDAKRKNQMPEKISHRTLVKTEAMTVFSTLPLTYAYILDHNTLLLTVVPDQALGTGDRYHN